MKSGAVWSQAVDELEVSVSRAYFESYIKQMWIKEVRDDNGVAKVKLACSSPFMKVEVEKKYGGLIEETLKNVMGRVAEVEYVVAKRKSKERMTEAPLIDFARSRQVESIEDRVKKLGLKTEYTLENYAVSSTNEMAYAAARAVAANPGKAYNPLYLYGEVGVGKTHLMQAIGQAVVRKAPETKLIYCTGEVFTNGIIEAIRKKSTPEFRKKYRKVAILMIDDIQFIAGKQTVQEEFFHTFNAITGETGQVIMTSDKLPNEIEGLEERLRSRFEGGLAIDIGQPDFELRSAILMIKSRQMGMELDTEAAQEIAGYEEDIRAMLGLFMKAMAKAQMVGRELGVELCQEVIEKEKQDKREKRGEVQPLELIRVVSEYYQCESEEVRGKRRLKQLTLPRHVAMYLLKYDLKMGLVEIGRWFSHRDHTTVMHGVGKIEKLLKEKPDTHSEVESIRKRLYG